MADQELKARLIVDKDGEPEAFADVAADVRQLKEEAEEAAPVLEELSEKQKELAEEAATAGENLDEQSTAVEQLVGKLGRLAAGAAAAFAALRAGWEIGTKLRGVLNDLTKGGFDRTVVAWSTSLLQFVGIAKQADDSAENLALAMATLKAKGIDPAKLSNEEILKTYLDLGKQIREHRAEQEKLTQAYEEFIEKTGLSKASLEATAASLSGVIAQFAAANSQLSQTDLTAIFGENVQQLLDQFRLLGVEVPPALAKVAGAWGVVTSVAEQEAAKHAAIVAKLRADILGAAADVVTDVRSLIAALPEALAGVDLDNLDLIDPAAAERARELLQQIVDAAQQAGVQIPAFVAEAAASFGILVPAMASAEEAFSSFTASSAQADNATAAVTARVDELGNIVLVQAERSREGAAALDELAAGAQRAGDGASTSAADIDALGQAAGASAQATREGGQALQEAAGLYDSAAQQVGTSTTALEGQAVAAGAAGESLGETARGAQEVAAASDAATAAAGTMEGQLGTLRTEVDQLRADFGALPALLRAAFEGASTATLREELALASAAARTLAEDLRAVQDAGAS